MYKLIEFEENLYDIVFPSEMTNDCIMYMKSHGWDIGVYESLVLKIGLDTKSRSWGRLY